MRRVVLKWHEPDTRLAERGRKFCSRREKTFLKKFKQVQSWISNSDLSTVAPEFQSWTRFQSWHWTWKLTVKKRMANNFSPSMAHFSSMAYHPAAPTTPTTPSRGVGSSGKRAIQPAAGAGPASSGGQCKKRIQFSSLGYVLPPPAPASVARRNARERNRVKQVNMGFAILRNHIPSSFGSSSGSTSGRSSSSGSGGGGGGGGGSSSKSRKVSKVDTLRCAVEYIRSLQELLDATPSEASSSSSENMSPPANTPHAASKSFSFALPTDAHHHHHHHHHQASTSLSPSCSSASSPTPSYESEHSHFTASSWDPYDHYEASYETPDLADSVAPNDDELLDAISWWQQSKWTKKKKKKEKENYRPGKKCP